MTYRYCWKNNAKREELYKRECIVIVRGLANSALVEFIDNGQREVISRNALIRSDKQFRKNKYPDSIVDLYNSGMTTQDIADLYGVSPSAMGVNLLHRGCKMRSAIQKGKDNRLVRGGEVSCHRAVSICEVAKRKGIIHKPEHCDVCGIKHRLIDAHHNDYNKPLDVTWMCRKCHYEWHKENKPIPLEGELPKRWDYTLRCAG